MQKLRVGAVSYLNTKPLIHRLQSHLSAKLVLDLPSRLADQLAAGRLDVALIPLIEFLRHPAYAIVSDACIACRGEVLSVKLYGRVPPGRIETLALDEGSRTSAVMAQIMLAERYAAQPDLVTLPIGHGLHDVEADATLLIGDRAIQTPDDGFEFVWDLGAKWCQWYSPSFVFAVWVARDDSLGGAVTQLLNESRDAGVAAFDEIAATEAGPVGLSHQECVSYLRDRLYFYLGPDEQDGIRLFADRAEALQLVDTEAVGAGSSASRRLKET